jgi:hypothetical protein
MLKFNFLRSKLYGAGSVAAQYAAHVADAESAKGRALAMSVAHKALHGDIDELEKLAGGLETESGKIKDRLSALSARI